MDKQGKTILNGRYKIIRPVGYGGMAEVFLAHDELLDRHVAVKMLRDQFLSDKELLEQFQREAKSAARLVHPYIINIYDVVSEGNNQYIVMEYVDGVTLKEYMQEHKLKLNTVLEIAVRLADALDRSYLQKSRSCSVTLKDNKLKIQAVSKTDLALEMWTFEDKAAFFEEVYGIKPILERVDK